MQRHSQRSGAAFLWGDLFVWWVGLSNAGILSGNPALVGFLESDLDGIPKFGSLGFRGANICSTLYLGVL